MKSTPALGLASGCPGNSEAHHASSLASLLTDGDGSGKSPPSQLSQTSPSEASPEQAADHQLSPREVSQAQPGPGEPCR